MAISEIGNNRGLNKWEEGQLRRGNFAGRPQGEERKWIPSGLEHSAVEVEKTSPAPLLELPDSLFGSQAHDERLDIVCQVRQIALREKLLRFAMKGVSAAQAARLVGVSTATARVYYSKPEFKKQLFKKIDGAFEGIDQAYTEEQETMHQKLERAAELAYSELMNMLEGKVAGVGVGHKIKIAQDFLNRNPESQQGFVHRSGDKLDAEQLQLAAAAAREMDAVAQGKLVELPRTGSE